MDVRPTRSIEPKWQAAPKRCYGCGYNLEGLVLPALCPECGIRADPQELALRIVVHKIGGKALIRRWVWILLGAATYILFSCAGIIVMAGSSLILLTTLVMVIVTIVGLLITSKRERKGSAWLLITSGGLCLCADLNEANKDDLFWPAEDLHSFHIKRVSSQWCNLKINCAKANEDNLNQLRAKGKLCLSAGIWLTEEAHGSVQKHLWKAMSANREKTKLDHNLALPNPITQADASIHPTPDSHERER